MSHTMTNMTMMSTKQQLNILYKHHFKPYMIHRHCQTAKFTACEYDTLYLAAGGVTMFSVQKMVTSLDSSIRQTKAKLKLVEHKYSQPQQIIMTTMKRLSEEDVRKIFNCVTNNKQPPERLKFKIIRVPQNGMKLSPPSFEFDGEK